MLTHSVSLLISWCRVTPLTDGDGERFLINIGDNHLVILFFDMWYVAVSLNNRERDLLRNSIIRSLVWR